MLMSLSLRHFCNIVEMFYHSGSHNSDTIKIKQITSVASLISRRAKKNRAVYQTQSIIGIWMQAHKAVK